MEAGTEAGITFPAAKAAAAGGKLSGTETELLIPGGLREEVVYVQPRLPNVEEAATVVIVVVNDETAELTGNSCDWSLA